MISAIPYPGKWWPQPSRQKCLGSDAGLIQINETPFAKDETQELSKVLNKQFTDPRCQAAASKVEHTATSLTTTFMDA